MELCKGVERGRGGWSHSYFFFNDTATTEIYTLSLHDALPILRRRRNSRTVVSAFLVAHTLLHWLFSDHPHYHFDSMLSSVLIVGAGLCGAVFLVLEWAGEDSNSV